MTADPPSDVGAPQRNATYCGPISTSVIQHGAVGTPGLTTAETTDGSPVPALLRALTRKM